MVINAMRRGGSADAPARNWLSSNRLPLLITLSGGKTMKTLRLDLEHLSVESFPTDSGADERGTVIAHESAPSCTLQPSFGNTACDLTWRCTLPGVC